MPHDEIRAQVLHACAHNSVASKSRGRRRNVVTRFVSAVSGGLVNSTYRHGNCLSEYEGFPNRN
jgi:hypothetical protein